MPFKLKTYILDGKKKQSDWLLKIELLKKKIGLVIEFKFLKQQH